LHAHWEVCVLHGDGPWFYDIAHLLNVFLEFEDTNAFFAYAHTWVDAFPFGRTLSPLHTGIGRVGAPLSFD